MDWTNILNVIFNHSLDVLIICWALESIIAKILKHMRFHEEEETKRIAMSQGINPYQEEYRLRQLELSSEEEEDEEQEPEPEIKAEQEQPVAYQQGYSAMSMEQKR